MEVIVENYISIYLETLDVPGLTERVYKDLKTILACEYRNPFLDC